MPLPPQLKGFLLFISVLLWSVQTLAVNPPFLSQQMGAKDWNSFLDQDEITFFEDKNPQSFESNATSSPLVKLSVGRTLSSLNMDAYSVVLAKDGKTAFASIAKSADIKVIDVSNLQKATVIGSVRLLHSEYPFFLTTLALSADDQTLFASSMQFLHLIDVSNHRAPQILGQLRDQNLTDNFRNYIDSKRYPFDFRISMSFSKDQKTIFIAGIGLQAIDISEREKPKFLHSNTYQADSENLKLCEVRISPSGETLFLANGTLNIYDINNVTNLKFLASYSIPSYSISSVFLSKQDENIVYIAGYSTLQKTLFEKISLKNPSNPVKLQSYDLENYKSRGALYILSLAFNETVAYIFAYPQESTSDVGVFNLQANKFKIEKEGSSRKGISSLAIFPDEEDKIIATQNFETLEVIQLYRNFPNTRIYSSANTQLAKLQFENGYFFGPSILSSDSKILIVTKRDNPLCFKIVNVSDPSNPQILSSMNKTIFLARIRFLEDTNRILVFSPRTDSISFLNISQDFKNIEFVGNYSMQNIEKIASFQFSDKNQIGYFVHKEGGEDYDKKTIYILRTVDFSGPSLKILKETQIDIYQHRSLLTKDNHYLILVGSRIMIFDVSDSSTPREISSTLIDFHDQETSTGFAYLSADEKTIFTRTFNGYESSLRIYDIRNFSAVKLLSDLPVPKSDSSISRTDFDFLEKGLLFSSDDKMAYMVCQTGYNIIAINVSNHTSPFVQGKYYVPNADFFDLESLSITKDGKTMFYSNDGALISARLVPPYSLYIDTESVRLGEKYSQSTALLQLNKIDTEYEIFNGEFKFIKASLFDVKINNNKRDPESLYLPLPNWMAFDKENQILTIEPKKKESLGTYTLYSAFSLPFPRDGFRDINAARNKSRNDDSLLMMMVSLGFLDQKLFLTPNFGTYRDFADLLYRNLTGFSEVYDTLKQYHYETFTSFDVFPSLDVTYSNFISVNTLSENQIRVEIKLSSNNKFINKQYASIKPTILGSQIILEGSQKEINNALELLVINLGDAVGSGPGPCEGTVSINDRLNPVWTNSFYNISKLFKINQPPKVEIPIQSQIDSQNIETGTYFTINFQNGTFVDIWNNDLSFELLNGNPGKSLPLWISFSNMSLRGTPPEEIIWRDLNFNLIVRNEFKSVKIPFSINVRISPTFALKLLARYSPYILTLVGLIVYANKIYNVIAKKRYRYPRDFNVKVGEEIKSSIIPPMIFIWNERQESLLILKHLKEKVAQELRVKSIKDIEFAEYFANSEGTQIDNEKLMTKIKETLQNISAKMIKKLDSYLNGAEESKDVIHKIIFNQLVIWLLEKNQETRKFFDMIKGDWIDLVEWDLNGMCKIKESQLIDIVAQADIHLEKDGNEEALIKEEINVNLLKDAIESYAFSKQSINHHSTTAHIMIKFKMEKDFIRRFFKKDLEDVNFSDRGKMTYGIYFKVENDVLSFHGIPEKRFLNKTVVIQITTKKHRILNEIWIHGVSKNKEINLKVNEETARGSSYEVY